MNLLDLPYELITYIYTFIITPKYIIRFSLTCKYILALMPSQQSDLKHYMNKMKSTHDEIKSIIYVAITGLSMRKIKSSLHIFENERRYMNYRNKLIIIKHTTEYGIDCVYFDFRDIICVEHDATYYIKDMRINNLHEYIIPLFDTDIVSPKYIFEFTT